MTAACAPSPSKKPTYAPTPAPLADPTDLRGSLAALGRTGYEDRISWRARESRAAVARAAPSAAPRRPLGFSRTEPVLSFAPGARSLSPPTPALAAGRATPGGPTTQDALNLAYSDGRRADELRPMWETAARSAARLDDLALRRPAGAHGDAAGDGDGNGAGDGGDGGDGFDLDEVLGPSGAHLSVGALGARADSASARIKKRALEEAAPALAPAPAGAGAGVGDDEEMGPPTDVEDEGAEGAGSSGPRAPLGVLAGPAGRRIAGAGARAFGRTQSLPASAFSGQMEF
ncbi:hypothetical protein JCM21900_001237 [Sporobolomyces salmonicolor]